MSNSSWNFDYDSVPAPQNLLLQKLSSVKVLIDYVNSIMQRVSQSPFSSHTFSECSRLIQMGDENYIYLETVSQKRLLTSKHVISFSTTSDCWGFDQVGGFKTYIYQGVVTQRKFFCYQNKKSH